MQKLHKNIETILELEKKAVRKRSGLEHFADRVTRLAGSPPFLVFHLVWFTGWIIINRGLIAGIRPFDPYPFSFLTLVVSLEAIFLTLLVLMSQNRMTKEADNRAALDLQINMLDEQETTLILKMVKKIVDHLGLEEEVDEAIQELSEQTDMAEVAKTLEEKSGNKVI
jgi:uncharacterized membrane protein